MSQSILVVDDDSDVRDLVCRMLEQDGYATIPAGDGREALEHLARQVPDLVITDVVMPGADGFEVLLRLRLLAPSTGVLVMSGGGRIGPDLYLETARRMGAKAVLSKPFTRAEMLDAVRQALSTCSQPTQTAQE